MVSNVELTQEQPPVPSSKQFIFEIFLLLTVFLRVSVNVDELVTYGLQQDDLIPQLISSKGQNENKALLDVVFETNPLDNSCGQRVHLNAEPIRIIYDAQTINTLVDIFKVPEESSALDQ